MTLDKKAVIPAHTLSSRRRPGSSHCVRCRFPWVPAFAGMTKTRPEQFETRSNVKIAVALRRAVGLRLALVLE